MHEGSTTPQERTKARKLVRAILATGCAVTVNNGGDDDEVTRSTDQAAILEAIGETGLDNLTVYDHGTRKGWFSLVWGNAEDGSELIADHTANDWCEGITGTVDRI
jgi:hypothetical protein